MANMDHVEAARSGDRKALGKLVQQHHAYVVQLARSVVGNPDDAEDVAQEVWVSVMQAIERFRRDSSFRTWLYRITVNKALNFIGRERRAELCELPEELADFRTPERFAEALDALRAMKRMPPVVAAAIRLREWGLSAGEIAEVFGLNTPTTVRTQMSKARAEAARWAGIVEDGEGRNDSRK